MGTVSGKFEVIVIGAGPAGMSAALGCASQGIATLLVEKGPNPGGQMLWTFNPIKNYPDDDVRDAREVAQIFAQKIEAANIELRTNVDLASVDLRQRMITTRDGRAYSAEAIVIASGVRRRKLGIPGETEFAGRGILVSGARDRETVAGKTVVIVGGGDAAIENALILSDCASKVIVVHRREDLRAREEFVTAARERKNVELLMRSSLTTINGDEHVESVEIIDDHGVPNKIDCDAVLIRVGVVPNTESFLDQIDLNDAGFILTNTAKQTTLAGAWAIGDVTGPTMMTIANAVSDALVAVTSIRESKFS